MHLFKQTNHEVYLVTAPEAAGCIMTWVLPCSLHDDAPQAMLLASPLNHTTQAILRSRSFVLHQLASGQHQLVADFGLPSGADSNKFLGRSDWQPTEFGNQIQGCAGYSYCRLVDQYQMGERIMLIGDMVHNHTDSQKPVLTKKEAFASLDEPTVDRLQAKHKSMADASRSLRKNNHE